MHTYSMADYSAELNAMPWAIEFPFNTLEIICHAGTIPQESRPPIKPTKLMVPGCEPTCCHPSCYTGGSIDYILLTLEEAREDSETDL